MTNKEKITELEAKAQLDKQRLDWINKMAKAEDGDIHLGCDSETMIHLYWSPKSNAKTIRQAIDTAMRTHAALQSKK